jgi:hypothetical protein
MQRFLVSALSAFIVAATSGTALGFCRTYTCEFDAGQVCDEDPDTGCKVGGVVAEWGSDCVTYAVQEDGSADQRISAQTLRGILADGFAAWSNTECPSESNAPDGASPSFAAAYRGETACDQVEYQCGGTGNDNIVMFRDGFSDLSATTIALSTIIANLNTGEILDVDIEINSQDFNFDVDGGSALAGAQDLRLVLNHELGHMLGLSHSEEPGSLMQAEYDSDSPLPARDDMAGMCSIFSPSDADPSCSAEPIEDPDQCVGNDGTCSPGVLRKESSGCSLRPTPASGYAGLPRDTLLSACAGALGLMAALGWRRNRAPRRSRRGAGGRSLNG